MTERQTRDYRIGYIRALATVMVVIIHIGQKFQQYYDNISWISDWFNLGLVLFFSISAFLYSKREIDNSCQWLAHRWFQLVGPSLFTAISVVLVFQLLYQNVTAKELVSAIVSGLGLEAFNSHSWIFVQYWFITYILICYATVPVIQKIRFKSMTEFQFWGYLIVVTIIMQGLLSLTGLLSGLPTPSWGVLLRFYLPYAMFRRYDDQSIRKPFVVMTILSIICIFIACIFRYGKYMEGIFFPLSELFFIYTQTLAGTVLFYWVYVFFENAKENKKILKLTDSFSYPIYLTHSVFILYDTSVIDKFTNHFVGVIVALLGVFIASMYVKNILVPICQRLDGYVGRRFRCKTEK